MNESRQSISKGMVGKRACQSTSTTMARSQRSKTKAWEPQKRVGTRKSHERRLKLGLGPLLMEREPCEDL